MELILFIWLWLAALSVFLNVAYWLKTGKFDPWAVCIIVSTVGIGNCRIETEIDPKFYDDNYDPLAEIKKKHELI